MTRQLILFVGVLMCTQQAMAKDCVILLHGLLRSPSAMEAMQTALESQYQVINNGYPSRSNTVQLLSEPAVE